MMSDGDWSEVVGILEDAVGPGRVSPAASVLVARGEQIVFEHSAGIAGPPGREHCCESTTIFDLASLTKPLVTAALTLDLIASGRLSLDTRVADILPAFAAGGDGRRSAVSIRHLLRHDSGLPAYKRYFESFDPAAAGSGEQSAAGRDRLVAMAVAEPLERDPCSRSVYSDLGFLVLGAVLEDVAGRRLDEFAAERIFSPLEVEDAAFVDLAARPASDFADRCATSGPCQWRGGNVHGVVQDQNAFVMGGVAAHAGLFATARGVHGLVQEWLDAWSGRGRVLDRRIVAHAWNRSSAAAGAAPSTWALGWDTPTPGGSTGGSRIGRDAVGHLGYTGTSVWIDPSRKAHVVLLTNRVAYGKDPGAIRALRPRLHDAVYAALDRPRR